MRAKGLNSASLARLAGINATGVRDIFNGKSRNPRSDTLQKIAAALECTVADLFAVGGQSTPPTAPEEPLPPSNVLPAPGVFLPNRNAMPLDVPVLGTAVGGDRGDFQLNGETVDILRRPPGIADRKDVFAIYTSGESMVPWRHPGDPVFCDPHRAARAGEYVVIECRGTDGEPGPAYLKQLVGVSETKLRLAQHNPPNKLEIERRRVKRVFRVIDWNELMGF